jgi:hypothetical protein
MFRATRSLLGVKLAFWIDLFLESIHKSFACWFSIGAPLCMKLVSSRP